MWEVTAHLKGQVAGGKLAVAEAASAVVRHRVITRVGHHRHDGVGSHPENKKSALGVSSLAT